MILMDVNILVYAHRKDTGNHPAYRDWVEETINGGGAYGVSELVLSGFIRVVIHPKVLNVRHPWLWRWMSSIRSEVNRRRFPIEEPLVIEDIKFDINLDVAKLRAWGGGRIPTLISSSWAAFCYLHVGP
jgi:predicted nucleic acid-binding protein